MISIISTVVSVSPTYCVGIFGLFIVSQTALLAAMLLPWKMLIALSRNIFPSALPDILLPVEQGQLVTILGVMAFAAFALHILCEALIGFIGSAGAQLILKKHDKTGLFDGYQRLGEKLYQNIVRSLATVLASILIVCILALIYPLLIAATVSYLLIGVAVLFAWHRLDIPADRKPSPALLQKAWWGGGFLYMLIWIVGDHWRGAQPNLTATFIGLFMSRQLLMFAGQIYQTSRSLLVQKAKVTALFLEEATWIPQRRVLDKFSTLLTREVRASWLPNLLRKHCGPDVEPGEVNWRSAEGGRVLYGIVEWRGADASGACLLKLHHRQLDALGMHEKDLLAAATADCPSPRLIGEDQVEGHGCLIFAWDRGQDWLKSDERGRALRSLRQKLLRTKLPVDLIARYNRTHPSLAQRLANIDWALLETLAPDENRRLQYAQVRSQWPRLIDTVDGMPRQLVLPGLKGRVMGSNAEGAAVICNWSRWRWEPVGAELPYDDATLGQRAELLKSATDARPELAHVSLEHVQLTALLYDFDKALTATDLTRLPVLMATLHDLLRLLPAEEATVFIKEKRSSS